MLALPAKDNGTFSDAAAIKIAELVEKRSCTLVGSGMRVTAGTVSVVSHLLSAEVPLVVDADGLNCIARLTSNSLDEFPELLVEGNGQRELVDILFNLAPAEAGTVEVNGQNTLHFSHKKLRKSGISLIPSKIGRASCRERV